MEKKESNRYVWCGSEEDICIPTTLDVDNDQILESLTHYVNVKKKDQGLFRFYDKNFQLECDNHCHDLHKARETVFNVEGLLSNILDFQNPSLDTTLTTPLSRTSKHWMSTIHEAKKNNNEIESELDFKYLCPRILAAAHQANELGAKRISPLPFSPFLLKRCQTDLSWIPHFLLSGPGTSIDFWANGERVATLLMHEYTIFNFYDLTEVLDLYIRNFEYMTKIVGPIYIYLTDSERITRKREIKKAKLEAIRVAETFLRGFPEHKLEIHVLTPTGFDYMEYGPLWPRLPNGEFGFTIFGSAPKVPSSSMKRKRNSP